jgi:hypothetical protein
MSRTLLAGLLGLALLAACAAPGAPRRTQADQDADAKTVAAAIAGADQDGASFSMDETLVFTGGDIPANQQAEIRAQASGVAKAGRVRMTYKLLRQKGSPLQYDIVLADAVLYIKPHSSSQWKRAPASANTDLYPAVSLELLRESVLLATKVGPGSITTVNNGFARRYQVKPAADQLEQLEAVSGSGSSEQAFLRTATAEIDAFLTVTGGKLTRIEVHLTGTDPDTGEKQKIDASANYTPAKVSPIGVPAESTAVDPSQILAT